MPVSLRKKMQTLTMIRTGKKCCQPESEFINISVNSGCILTLRKKCYIPNSDPLR